MLRLENITKTFKGPGGEVRAVAGVSLEVGEGEFVAVRGPSGCGKSTLLLAAGGLQHPDGGRVLIHGTDPYVLSPEARSRYRARHVGFVFQQFHLVPYLSVRENVLAASLALPATGAEARAGQLLDQLGLGDRMHHVPAALSTGEKQRTALARALLNGPRLLLADEPTGNLDEDNGRKVLAWLAEHARGGGAVLLVTHDPKAAAYATRTIQMAAGRWAE